MLSLERRAVDSRAMQWASPLLALVLTIITGMGIFMALGKDPVEGLTFFFLTPLSDTHGWAELGLKMAPLLLCVAALSLTRARRVPRSQALRVIIFWCDAREEQALQVRLGPMGSTF